jgi:hypothetical protein
MDEARKNGPQSCSPQWLPCIKMDLTIKFLNIYLVLNLPPRLPRTSSLYGLEVGNKLPTSPQYLASKMDLDPPKMTKIHQYQAKNQ